jgi:predicted dehydrogenase
MMAALRAAGAASTAPTTFAVRRERAIRIEQGDGTAMERVRIGVVGAGFMGGLHARVVAESGLAHLAAVADPDAVRGGELAERYGATAYPSHEGMLAGERLAAVIVATPEPLHRDAVVAAAGHGAAVLVEKPIAASLADADAMIAACDAAGVH